MDEDVGPIAEYDLAVETKPLSAINDEPVVTSIPSISIIDDYLSMFNIRLLFKDVFYYSRDLIWYRYFSQTFPDNEIELHRFPSQSFQRLLFLSIIYLLCTFSLPVWFHCFPMILTGILMFIDFIRPVYIYFHWFQCLKSMRFFIRTVEIHREWLKKIEGFQLIRPISSLFQSELFQFRQTIFEQVKQQFLIARQIARLYSNDEQNLISSIDLEEFGPLMSNTGDELVTLTNRFDPSSIQSMFKLCQLQINETIELIHLKRPQTFKAFYSYRQKLLNSIEQLNFKKRQCSVMMSIDGDRPAGEISSSKLTLSYFLLRSAGEELFHMNENKSIDAEGLKRIIQDLKTVIFSLEALQHRSIVQSNDEAKISTTIDDVSTCPISSVHRFDDQIEESIDEILIGESSATNESEEMKSDGFDLDQDEQRFLREQTRFLMKELQTAIQGKKQEWNEREQRLLGPQTIVLPEKEETRETTSFERIIPMSQPISMLDELKKTFVLNQRKLNTNEETFGEEEDEETIDSDIEMS